MKRLLSILLIAAMALPLMAQERQNNPYSDESFWHLGFGLGVSGTGFWTTAPGLPSMGVATASSHLSPGFVVTLNADIRLCRFLNLRFTPGIMFADRTLDFGSPSMEQQHINTLPIVLPLYLKWSADREANYRPYVIAGGGASYEALPAEFGKEVYLKPWNYFCEFGLGCDFYLPWFRLSPELKYQIGFADQLKTKAYYDEHPGDIIYPTDFRYTNALSRLTTHMISLVINFESR